MMVPDVDGDEEDVHGHEETFDHFIAKEVDDVAGEDEAIADGEDVVPPGGDAFANPANENDRDDDEEEDNKQEEAEEIKPCSAFTKSQRDS
ncbi:hypothetical protein SEMRO_239_G095730.1 [Seminavis robusta]|uniref:Uncharacterized protein n=1 Tax=Seminavis robusta TaxID=568900 RepID=A0A9N8H8F9_9STRA|nr:hypothetical protein SEMRO_239_G095730.1 [Seminavis robusta]|eukprot:Sro239_g095730.1 n/a (91) ;mRNA; r:1733-2005